jgi:hypothetical protein
MQYHIFSIQDRQYCVWDWDLKKTNLDFISQIDPKYFEYVTKTNFDNIESHDKQYAAINLRITYYHSLETLFSLILGAIFAPSCVVAYIQKLQPGDIRAVLNKINRSNVNLPNIFNKQFITWEDISSRFNRFAFPDPEKLKKTQELFANLWSFFSSEFCDPKNNLEYNGIKHGFRAKPGGFGIAIGLQKMPDVPCPAEEMQFIGSSEFGSSFFAADKIGDEKYTKDPNFRIVNHSLNWNPEAVSYSILLASMSINNVQSFLKIANGVNCENVIFLRPEDDDSFNEPLRMPNAPISSSFNLVINESDIKRYTKSEMKDILNKVNKKGSN